MFSTIKSSVCIGIEGKPVNVELDISNGLPNMNIVGLASASIMEARERIKSAIINSGYEYPRGRITVNLTPADIHKSGSNLDLPMAIALLTSMQYIDRREVGKYGMIGELSLDGNVLGVEGVLPMLLCMTENGIKNIIIPRANVVEASLVNNANIMAVNSLRECVELINNPSSVESEDAYLSSLLIEEINNPSNLDFRDIKGQDQAKRAITIAVTGRHGLLMVGSPGCGKTMMAKRIPTIMPNMSASELVETAIVYSIIGKNNRDGTICIDRPFRSPHNSIGRAGLLGGGSGIPVPGEITLAHNGVLFLDEVCEFDRDKIESLRLPVEEKTITHIRNGIAYTFPCNFQLVMAANPCKCGYYGDGEHICKCTQSQLYQYRRKLSGPMMERIDLRLRMDTVSYDEIIDSKNNNMSSSEMKSTVERGIAFARKMGRPKANGDMTDAEIEKYCSIGSTEQELMRTAYSKLSLSPRSYRKTLKVARTIADMDESEAIKCEHLAEALSYRVMTSINEAT